MKAFLLKLWKRLSALRAFMYVIFIVHEAIFFFIVLLFCTQVFREGSMDNEGLLKQVELFSGARIIIGLSLVPLAFNNICFDVNQ